MVMLYEIEWRMRWYYGYKRYKFNSGILWLSNVELKQVSLLVILGHEPKW